MILVDKNDKRKYLPIIIGFSEARAIKCELDSLVLFRPLTHNLFTSLFESIVKDYSIEFVSIDNYEDGVFFASIVVKNPDGTFSSLDARPSDAIAIALHAVVPIYFEKELFHSQSIKAQQTQFNPDDLGFDDNDTADTVFDETTEESYDDEYDDEHLELFQISFLEEELEYAVKTENYEYAERIQKIINKKKDRKNDNQNQ